MAKLQITLVRSVIGRPETQRVTVKTLGLCVNSTRQWFTMTVLQFAE